MRFAKPHVFVSAVLVSWACAKNGANPGTDSYTPTGATSGRGGTSARSGTGGSSTQGGSNNPSGATGGSAAASGGSSGIEEGGRSGSQTSGGTGGSVAAAGRKGTGGGSVTAGRSGTGGTNSMGGVTGTGGDGIGGGMPAGGATSSGGTGAAGLPNDPNWKPPDMSGAKLVVLYACTQTAASSTNITFNLNLQNNTDTPYDLSAVTLRYWMSSEPPPAPALDYAAAGMKLSSTIQFVPNNANSYLKFTFGKGGVAPPWTAQNADNDTRIQARVQGASGINNQNFNQANDWSFDKSATAAKPNPKITLYDGDTLIWGCEPSHVCADTTSMTGEAGAGGQPAK
jgi:hypothetical protein